MNEFKIDKFYEIKNLLHDLHYSKRESAKGTYKTRVGSEYYQRNKAARLERTNFFNTDKRAIEFFNWFCKLKIKANMNRIQFAKALGVNKQMITNYTNRTNFPTESVIIKAFALEKILALRIRRMNRNIRLRTNGISHRVADEFLTK